MANRTQNGPPDFSVLTVEIERSHESKARGKIAAIVAMLSFVAGVVFFWNDVTKYMGQLLALGASLVFLLVWGLLKFLFPSRQSITIDQDTLRVVNSGEFGKEEWTAPVHSFSKVLWLITDKGIGLRKYTGHMVKLIHPDPAKTVVLYAGHSDDEARTVWLAAAKTLNLPTEEGISDDPKATSDEFADSHDSDPQY